MDKNKLLHNLLALLKAGQKDEARALSEAATKNAVDDPTFLSNIGSIFLRQGESSTAAKYLNQSLEVRKKQYEHAETVLTNDDLEYLEEQENEIEEEDYAYFDDFSLTNAKQPTTDISAELDDNPSLCEPFFTTSNIELAPVTDDSDNNSNANEKQVFVRSPSSTNKASEPPETTLNLQHVSARPTLSLNSSGREKLRSDAAEHTNTNSGIQIIKRRSRLHGKIDDTEISEHLDHNETVNNLEITINTASTHFQINDLFNENISDDDEDLGNDDIKFLDDLESKDGADEDDRELTDSTLLPEQDDDLDENQYILSEFNEDEFEWSEVEISDERSISNVDDLFIPDIVVFDQDTHEGDFSEDFNADFLESLDEISDDKEEKNTRHRITRRQRAQQVATEIIRYAEWQKSTIEDVTDIFEEYGWSRTKNSILTAIDNGATLDQILTARDLRNFWRDNERFWMTFSGISSSNQYSRATYCNLAWPHALQLVTYRNSVLSLDEIEHYIEEEFDYWYDHSLLRRSYPSFLKYLFFRKTDLAFWDMASYGENGIGSLALSEVLDEPYYQNPLSNEVQRLESLGVSLITKASFKPVFHSLISPYKNTGEK